MQINTLGFSRVYSPANCLDYLFCIHPEYSYRSAAVMVV